jgi:hypothetical protein
MPLRLRQKIQKVPRRRSLNLSPYLSFLPTSKNRHFDRSSSQSHRELRSGETRFSLHTRETQQVPTHQTYFSKSSSSNLAFVASVIAPSASPDFSAACASRQKFLTLLICAF